MKSPKQGTIKQKDLKVEDILMNADYRQQSIISEALESQENTTQNNRQRSGSGVMGGSLLMKTHGEQNIDD